MTDQAAQDATGGSLVGFLRRTHLSRPADLAEVVAGEATRLGAEDVVVYLIDYEQDVLVPVPYEGSPERTEQVVEATMAGRTFATSAILHGVAGDGGGPRLWLPLLDGTDRLGVLELRLREPVNDDLTVLLERFAHLVAQSVVTKNAYGDVFERIRRRRPMTVASELLWRLLPPLTFATDDFVVSAILEPCYSIGGDAFDYAVNDHVAHVAVFDGMGHGLAAAGLTSFALAAYRVARRSGEGLFETYAMMDTAVLEQFAAERYVTAILAELDLITGRFRWLSAGHPPPLLIRGGRVVKTLEAAPCTPIGVPFAPACPQFAEEQLESGDLVLFYTDGLPEARLADGEFFGVERLGEFVEREAAAGHPAPETLRRLRRSVLAHQRGELQDDATAVLIEWRRGGERRLVPSDVL